MSTKLICERCKEVFDPADATRSQVIGATPTDREPADLACPECGCGDLEEATCCPVCDEWYREHNAATCLNCGGRIHGDCTGGTTYWCGTDCHDEHNANARLGALVRRMKCNSSLVHSYRDVWFCPDGTGPNTRYDTPEAALEAAYAKMEEVGK